MIDNDIERVSKDFEFGNIDRKDSLRQYNDPNDIRSHDMEWKIE